MITTIKKLVLSGFITLATLLLSATETQQWIRYAAISPDGNSIAFTFQGDIFVVPAQGGEARALTYHQAFDYMPVWSNDSKQISFASNRFGDFDIFVIDAKGGEPLRLTFHSANEYPYSFSNDNKSIIFGGQRMDAVNHRQFPTGSQPEVYSVPVGGGRINQLWTIPAESIQVSADGKTMIYHDKKGGENEWRKHHKSAITRDIWKYDVATNKHTMLTSFEGEDRNPVFAENDNAVFYLSEQNGTFNVHKFGLSNPSKVEQITRFQLHPVRFLSIAKNGTLCYTHHGDLYTQTLNGTPNKLNVSYLISAKTNNELVIPVSGNVSEMAVSPNGKEIAYIVRGEVFVSSVEGEFTKRVTSTSAQERFISFAPDGKSIIYASQRDSKWGVYRASKLRESEPYFFAATLFKEEALLVNENDNYLPQVSPNGKEIAFIENRRSLKIFNIETKQIREFMGPDKIYYMRDGDQEFQWSPDSKWLLFTYNPSIGVSEVVLVDVSGQKSMINLTESGFGDSSGKWVNNGKQILWLSDRNGMRDHATSGSRQLDAYSMFLTRDSWDKFNMSKDEYDLWKEIEKLEKEKEKKKKDEAAKDDKKKKKDQKDDAKEAKADSTLVKFDWDGLRDRKARLTIHSSNLADAVLSKDGETLYYLARFEKGLNLWSTNLRTKETKMAIALNARSGRLEWCNDMSKLFLLSDGRISTIDLKANSTKPIAVNGEMTLNVAAERHLMFDHVWKRNKAMFYISNFHGAPWEQLRTEYKPKVDLVSNDFELAELLSEMLGELNVSHSGARTRSFDPNGTQTASLGIFMDYSHTGDGIKIAEVIKFGPLDKSHITINPGSIITKIDGEAILANADYAKYLNRKTDKFTLIEIVDPVSKVATEITIKPISLGQENSLLYDRWVKKNEEEVERLSNGQLGYVHIPGMSDEPYRNTYERALGKYANTKGLIIDTRFNGGGDLVSDLAMFLTGKRFIEYAIESRTVGGEPVARWTKPSIAMVNESNYSDGHCFACGYQDLGIGLLVGMPVPGTCSFAGWETLQNGTITWGSIPVSAKNIKGQWMENNQTVPEVMVKNMPGIIDNGRDQQLEKAVEELLKITK
jgi:Tol biopolymer transport system component